MEREILFRGLTESGEWIEGFYLESEYCDGKGVCSFIKKHGYSEIKVIPETVGQYTGLKDKNGLKSFSSEIVIVNYGRHHNEKKGLTRVGVIEFDEKSAAFVIAIKDSKVKVSFSIVHSFEII